MNEAKRQARPEVGTRPGEGGLTVLEHRLGGRRRLLLVGIVGATAGLWLGWPALVAAGVAPLVLGVLPCVAMCALGLCMRSGGRSCDARSKGAADAGPRHD